MKHQSLKWSVLARYMLLLACTLCLIWSFSGRAKATDKVTPAYYEAREITQGVMISEVKSNIRTGPGTDYDIVTRMRPGETCEVLGEENGWYHILYNGREGYILKDFLSVSTFVADVEKIVEDKLSASVTNLSAPRVMERRETFTLQGTLTSNIPLISVTASVTNLRTFQIETSSAQVFQHSDQVTECDLFALDNDLRFSRLSAGEKRLTITAQSANDQLTVVERDFYVLGKCAEPNSMTADCDISDRAVTDNRTRTAWTPNGAGDELSIKLPEERQAEWITLEWTKAPNAFIVEMLDASGAVINTIDERNEGSMIAFAYETGDARQIVVRAQENTDAGVMEARVYEAGKTPEMVQRWQPLTDKVDAMVIAAHMGDELLFFGGALPYLTQESANIVVVYMTDCGIQRYVEALDGLWSVGVRVHPICLGLQNKSVKAYEDAIDLWGLEDTYEMLVDLIRHYQPDVIITHDIEGEDGDQQHKLTSATVRHAVLAAADTEQYPDSYEQYGAWDVPKTYIHRYEGNVLTLDMEKRLSNANEWTAQELLLIGYDKNRTLMDDYPLERGAKYDHQTFGLIRSMVDQDINKNSFFENVKR